MNELVRLTLTHLYAILRSYPNFNIKRIYNKLNILPNLHYGYDHVIELLQSYHISSDDKDRLIELVKSITPDRYGLSSTDIDNLISYISSIDDNEINITAYEALTYMKMLYAKVSKEELIGLIDDSIDDFDEEFKQLMISIFTSIEKDQKEEEILSSIEPTLADLKSYETKLKGLI